MKPILFALFVALNFAPLAPLNADGHWADEYMSERAAQRLTHPQPEPISDFEVLLFMGGIGLMIYVSIQIHKHGS